jgi:D-alanyl-D-alanine carboxypeptidase (penicillin-binding protein 5/6)
MTDVADEIGLENSHFANATGWPDPDHWMTAHDLARLAKHTIHDFPEYYHFFSETEFTWHDITQSNRNRLLYRNIGADGLKTGHTEEAGYGLTVSAEQQGRRLILVVSGLESDDQRTEESARLLAWGFREFDNYDLLSAGESLGEAEVWMGQSETVELVSPTDLTVTLPRAAKRNMTATLVYEGPIQAPIAEGQEIAMLRISAEGLVADLEVPLVAASAVEEVGPMGRIIASLKHLILGNL